ncbi:MAG: WD40 repeat domain-containing protein [Sulfurovum sp.]|nr:WD40 repeat domain-containing protein [Sulfurovum sp.]
MMRLFLMFASMFGLVCATITIEPYQKIAVGGYAKDIVVHGGNIYIGTDDGRMQIYNYQTKQFEGEVKFPDIKDFTGDIVPTRVSSLDTMDGRYIMLTDSGIGGYANIWLHENNSSVKLISHEDKRTIVKIRFIDKNHILLGYLGNEVSLFDIKQKKELYRTQLSSSKFSDFALNNDRSRAAFGCESGVITIVDVRTGKTIIELSSINKDNTYKVDFKSGIVSGAGQDRVGSIYDVSTGKSEGIHGDFLIYATGLSPSAQRVAFAIDEQNNIAVYKTSTRSKLFLLKGQKSTLNSIVFIDEDTIVSASDDDTVMLWKLK